MGKILFIGLIGLSLCLAGCNSAVMEVEPGESITVGVNETDASSIPTMTIMPLWAEPAISTIAGTPTFSITPVLGNQYFVAVDGDDGNVGSIDAPFRTFIKGLSMLKAGDALFIRGGTYNQMLEVDVNGIAGKPITITSYADEKVVIDMQGQNVTGVSLNGDYLQFSQVEVRASDRACVVAAGDYQGIWGLTITDCFSSGIQLSGGHIDFFGNLVFGTVLRNENGNGRSWNSAVKVQVGAHDLVIRENEIFGNWGEGIAVTRGGQIIVRSNRVYDNWASNIYIDNSFDVLVEQNFSFCTENSPLADDGFPANAFAIGEEQYEGWGPQLARVTLINNIGAYCKRGIGAWSAEMAGGGLDTVIIVNNTFWGSRLHGIGIYVNGTPTKARGTLIQNNIFHQADSEHGYIENLTGITIDKNFWVGEPPPTYKRILGPNDLWGDAGMVTEPIYTPESFQLAAGSQAIGQGIRFDFLSDDFFGRARDNEPDIGAVEFGE